MTSALLKKHEFDFVFDSQGVFRLVLEAVSNPFRRVSIKEYEDKVFGSHPLFFVLAMTLLDNEVSFSVLGDDKLAQEIKSVTLSKETAVHEADFIFVCDTACLKEAVEKGKCGTLKDPHKSAAIIVYDTGAIENEITIYGPGVQGRKKEKVSAVLMDILKLRGEQFFEYPQGLDFILITDLGELYALPRLVCREV